MKRISLYAAILISLALCVTQAHAVEVVVLDPNALIFSGQGPGTAPENTFPLVCYVVEMPVNLVKALRNEAKAAKEAATKGQTIPLPLTEQYKNGVPMPMFTGYYIVTSDFRIAFEGTFQARKRQDSLLHFNRAASSQLVKAPYRSWHGALAYIQSLARNAGTDTMVYTTGVMPDSTYIPQIKRPVIVPLSKITDSVFTPYPSQKDFDATIINPKPGMTFKAIDKDFIIP